MESERRESTGALRQAVESVERRMIIAELIASRGRMNAAARALGISMRIMGLRVRKYGIDVRAYRRVTRKTSEEHPT